MNYHKSKILFRNCLFSKKGKKKSNYPIFYQYLHLLIIESCLCDFLKLQLFSGKSDVQMSRNCTNIFTNLSFS
jgi:hypothetical protein